MRPSHKAWIGIGAGVAAYEVLCPNNETLSEGLDEFLEHPTRKYAVMAAVGATALHLCNVLPERYDPFHYALKWK